MDSKRKANGSAPVEPDDRAAKRRKLAQEYDLTKGETRESTTAYGMNFLDQIRRTADKSGRLVAKNFEKLPSRKDNKDYYKKTRMPISLEDIEEKLNNGYFATMAQLECYFKRMISNVKDFYPRSSSNYDDAERLRKALSNYMVRTNPAYKDRTYAAVPTPIPDEAEEEVEEAEGEEQEEVGEEEQEEGNEDAEEDDDAEVEAEGDAEVGGEEAEEEKEDEEDEEGENEEEEEEEPTSRKRQIILKRRGPGRPRRSSRGTPKKVAPPPRPDHEFEDVPYRGLNFQQAQEKLVEELLRHQEPEYEDAYFEPFINLPPRALKDYYKVISDPISIRKLQKMVKGVRGRGELTGVSDFKTWGGFEEKAKLLWTNAYFYNEEGSDIYVLAQELEKFVYKQLKEAQAAAIEPSQPKIKLKVAPTAEAPPTTKKITIHVGGRGGSAESPSTPQAKQQPPEAPAAASQQLNGTNTAASTPAQPQAHMARSVSASAPSPSPSVPVGLKAEESSVASPAGVTRPPSASSGQATLAPVKPPAPPVQQPPPFQHNPLANGYMEQKRLRGQGKGIDDALIARVRIWSLPTVPQGRPVPLATVLPSPKEMQTSATLNITPSQSRVFIVPMIPEHLRNRQYSLWTLVNKLPVKPSAHQLPGQQPLERCFEAILQPGINVVESHLIAAVPRGERVPGGPEVELEVFTIFVNVLRT